MKSELYEEELFMIITVRFWRRKANFEADYNNRIEKQFKGDTAKECMRQIDIYKDYHNLAEYTEPEIINVED